MTLLSPEKTNVTIVSHVSLDSKWVRRGETFTVTGKGINAAGDATVHLYSGEIPENDDWRRGPLAIDEPGPG